MASVQEILLALEGQKSPFVSLLEGVTGGMATAQSKALDNAKTLIALEQDRQDRARAAENDRMLREQMGLQAEAQTKNAFNAVGAPPTVFPAQKFKIGMTTDEKGYLKPKFEITEPKEPSLDSMAAERVRRGEMSLEEAYAMKNRTGVISPSLGYQMEKDKVAKVKSEKSKVIPGWTPTGEVEVDEVEARKLRDSVSEFESFTEGLKQYRALIEKHGTAELTDRNVQGKMSSLAKNLQLKIKNLAQLGVLSASDIPFIEEQIPGPGLLKTSAGMLGALDTAGNLMRTAVETKMKTSGYAREGAPSVPRATGGAAANQTGKIKVSNGKETLLIDPADAADAAKDGYMAVQ